MDGLITYFSQHHDQLLYAIAGLCLVLELGVLGMSGPLLFIALSCIITGVLVTFGLVTGWETEVVFVGVLAVISAFVLWKPLKKFQNADNAVDTSSDMIGRSLLVTYPISRDQGRVAYSGIDWQARLDQSVTESIPVGARAVVNAVNGSLLVVRPE